jgi:hypothetical protein
MPESQRTGPQHTGQQRTGQEVATAGGREGLRVSHEDRDQVAEVLRVAAGDGRLTANERDERLERALTARTYGELAVLTTDLPDPASAGTGLAGPGGVPPASPKELLKIHLTSGNSERHGRWVVPSRMDLKVTSGNIRLDFAEAVSNASTLHIDAEVRSGNITLLTRPGIAVDFDDVVVRSGNVRKREHRRAAAAAVLPGVAAARATTVRGPCLDQLSRKVRAGCYGLSKIWGTERAHGNRRGAAAAERRLLHAF